MNEQQRYQLIEDYLKNRLSDKDKIEFEELLETDAVLFEEFQLMQASYSVFSLEEVAYLKENLKQVANKRKQYKKKIKGSILAFGLIGIGLTLGIFLLQHQEKNTNEDNIADTLTLPAPIKKDNLTEEQQKDTAHEGSETTNVYERSTNTIKATPENILPDKKKANKRPDTEANRNKDTDETIVVIKEDKDITNEEDNSIHKKKYKYDSGVDVSTTDSTDEKDNGVIKLLYDEDLVFNMPENILPYKKKANETSEMDTNRNKNTDETTVVIKEDKDITNEEDNGVHKEKYRCDFDVEISTTDATAEKDNGVIELLSGEDLVYSIKENTEFSDLTYYNNLNPGKYLVRARDKNKCIDTIKTVHIKRDVCSVDYNKVFNLNYEEKWKVPTTSFKGGEVKILDKSLNKVFSYTFNEGEELYWDGTMNNGEPSPTLGLHKVIITYTDNTKCIHELIIAK